VYAAQAREHEAHDEARALPQPCEEYAVDDKFLVVERIEDEGLPAEAAHHVLHAEIRIEDPLPDQPGDDEGQREGIEEDGAERILEAYLQVEQGGEHETDREREDQRQNAIDRHILDQDEPALRRLQPLI